MCELGFVHFVLLFCRTSQISEHFSLRSQILQYIHQKHRVLSSVLLHCWRHLFQEISLAQLHQRLGVCRQAHGANVGPAVRDFLEGVCRQGSKQPMCQSVVVCVDGEAPLLQEAEQKMCQEGGCGFQERLVQRLRRVTLQFTVADVCAAQELVSLACCRDEIQRCPSLSVSLLEET